MTNRKLQEIRWILFVISGALVTVALLAITLWVLWGWLT